MNTESIHRNERGWIVPITAADGDAWREEERAFEIKWKSTVCVCGHGASGSDNESYHQPAQGSRCRAPFVNCDCMEFRPKPCESIGCASFAQRATGTLCERHASAATAATPRRTR